MSRVAAFRNAYAYASLMNRLPLVISAVNITRALLHPPCSTITPTSPMKMPTPASMIARRIAERKNHTTRMGSPVLVRLVRVATVVAGQRARSTSSSRSSSSSASPEPQNHARPLSSRLKITACVRSSVDIRSCRAVSEVCICCRVCGMVDAGANVDAEPAL